MTSLINGKLRVFLLSFCTSWLMLRRCFCRFRLVTAIVRPTDGYGNPYSTNCFGSICIFFPKG